MKTWKLVSGILSIVMSVYVVYESSMAGLANALSANGEVSGTAGVLVAVLILSAGIVSIATRKGGKGGNIALIVLFGLGALIGYTNGMGIFADLLVWATWCLICLILAVVCLVRKPKTESTDQTK